MKREVHRISDEIVYPGIPKTPIEESGEVTTCWELSPEEKKQVQETGVIWLSMLTFNQPLQPVLLKTEKPDFENENRK